MRGWPAPVNSPPSTGIKAVENKNRQANVGPRQRPGCFRAHRKKATTGVGEALVEFRGPTGEIGTAAILNATVARTKHQGEGRDGRGWRWSAGPGQQPPRLWIATVRPKSSGSSLEETAGCEGTPTDISSAPAERASASVAREAGSSTPRRVPGPQNADQIQCTAQGTWPEVAGQTKIAAYSPTACPTLAPH